MSMTLYRWSIWAPETCVFHVRAESEQRAREAARYLLGGLERLPKGTLVENMGECEYQPG